MKSMFCRDSRVGDEDGLAGDADSWHVEWTLSRSALLYVSVAG